MRIVAVGSDVVLVKYSEVRLVRLLINNNISVVNVAAVTSIFVGEDSVGHLVQELFWRDDGVTALAVLAVEELASEGALFVVVELLDLGGVSLRQGFGGFDGILDSSLDVLVEVGLDLLQFVGNFLQGSFDEVVGFGVSVFEVVGEMLVELVDVVLVDVVDFIEEVLDVGDIGSHGGNTLDGLTGGFDGSFHIFGCDGESRDGGGQVGGGGFRVFDGLFVGFEVHGLVAVTLKGDSLSWREVDDEVISDGQDLRGFGGGGEG